VSEPRIFLVDASIYVFRSWHVLPDTIVDADGEPANAVYGFADFLLQFLARSRPTHLALAFDESLASSVRNDLFPEYKANRDPAPDELRRQFRLCRELATAAGFAGFSSPHFEADDVIATIAARMREHGFRHTVVTGDKDLAQLLHDGDEWWDFQRERRLDRHGVEKHFGVRPDQIADMLALAGDKIDNIPGVPGIGQATAARLLRRWGDIDAIYASLDQVPTMQIRGAKRIAALLAEHEPAVRLARQLTGTLDTDCVPSVPDAYIPGAPDAATLDDCFDRLGFGPERRRRWYDAVQAPVTP
jgi:5'-3' exonuclease